MLAITSFSTLRRYHPALTESSCPQGKTVMVTNEYRSFCQWHPVPLLYKSDKVLYLRVLLQESHRQYRTSHTEHRFFQRTENTPDCHRIAAGRKRQQFARHFILCSIFMDKDQTVNRNRTFVTDMHNLCPPAFILA